MSYASHTTVGADRSLAQIRRLLEKAGATGFAFAEQDRWAKVLFELQGRRMQYIIPLPELADFAATPGGRYKRNRSEQQRLYQLATNARWRAIHLLIKAKLEAVTLNVLSFEDAFLPETLMPDNVSVADWTRESLREALSQMPPQVLLEAGIV